VRAGGWIVTFVLLAGCGPDAPTPTPPEASAARAAAEEWRSGAPVEGTDAATAERTLARAEELLASGTPDAAAFREADRAYREAITARAAKREALYREALDARAKARALRTRLSEQQTALAAAGAAPAGSGDTWIDVRDRVFRDVFKSERLLATDVALEKADVLFADGHHAEAKAIFGSAEADLIEMLARVAEAEAEARARAALEEAEKAVVDMRQNIGRGGPPSAAAAESALDAARRAEDRRDFARVRESSKEVLDLAAKANRHEVAVTVAFAESLAAKRALEAWVAIGAAENEASRAGREKLREGEAAQETDPQGAAAAFRAAKASFEQATAAAGKEKKERLGELRTKKVPPPLPPDPLDSEKAAEGVRLALDWLARHQDDDGRWSSSDYIRHDPRGAARADTGGPLFDPGVTGLALLCFLSAGYSDRGAGDAGYYALNVEQALRWLRSAQADDGVFGSRATRSFMYNHAIATIAMAEAARRTRDPALRKSAEIAVRYVEAARNSGSAWRYDPGSGANDTSVTVWCVEALAAAEAAGIAVDPAAFRGALAWVDSMTDGSGRTGYDSPGGSPSRVEDLVKRFPPSRSESMTAAGILIRVLARQAPPKSDVVAAGTKLIFDQPPLWSPDAGSIDMYYWRAATRALRLSRCRDWATWSRQVQAVALRWQVPVTGAHNAGSWDPIDAWGEEGGRIYSTAMMTLALIESARPVP
jgi:hypothetical protein